MPFGSGTFFAGRDRPQCPHNRLDISLLLSLLRIDNQTDSGQHKYSYVYDYVGNRTVMSVTDSGGTKMHVYSYDNIYQLTDVNYPVGYDYLGPVKK